jgi:regulator of RNase E activity RraA
MNDKEIRRRFGELSCAALCDASPLVKAIVPGLVPVDPGRKMVGRVFPISCANDYLTVIKGMSDANPGDVLVIDGRGQTQAIFGDLLAAEASRKGLAGAVVDGAIRDVPGIRKLEFPVYYRLTNPRAGRTEIVEPPTNIVSIGNVALVRGDWIMGDSDGVVVIPASQVDEILSVAEEIQKIEAEVFKSIRKGESLMEIIRFEEFRRDHEREIRSNLEYHLTRR